MGTRSRAWVSAIANPHKNSRYYLQQVKKRLIITVPAFLCNAGLFAQGSFQLSLWIDNGIKGKVVSSSFPCHWGKNDAPSISSSLTCTGLCIVIPLLLWRASSLSFTLQTIPRESRGASEMEGGSAGSWLLCMSCMHFSSVLRKSLVKSWLFSGKNSTRRPHFWCFLAINDWRPVIFFNYLICGICKGCCSNGPIYIFHPVWTWDLCVTNEYMK